MGKPLHNLPPWEWITLIGVICTGGVAVTVFAFQTFEAQGAAAQVKIEVREEIKEMKNDFNRVETKLDALLLKEGLNPRAFEGK